MNDCSLAVGAGTATWWWIRFGEGQMQETLGCPLFVHWARVSTSLRHNHSPGSFVASNGPWTLGTLTLPCRHLDAEHLHPGIAAVENVDVSRPVHHYPTGEVELAVVAAL